MGAAARDRGRLRRAAHLRVAQLDHVLARRRATSSSGRRRAFSRCASSCRARVKAPQVRRAEPSSKVKFANLIQIRHRDEVEAPVTDWLQEAYDFAGAQAAKPAPKQKKAAAEEDQGCGREAAQRRRQRRRRLSCRRGGSSDPPQLRRSLPGQIEHPLHDLVDRHAGRVDQHGVLRQRQRRRGARLVRLIARLDGRGDRRLPRLAARVRACRWRAGGRALRWRRRGRS